MLLKLYSLDTRKSLPTTQLTGKWVTEHFHLEMQPKQRDQVEEGKDWKKLRHHPHRWSTHRRREWETAHSGNIKCTSIFIIGVPEGEKREKGLEKILEEIIAEDFPNMGKEIVNQVQEAQSPIQGKPKEEHAEHIVIKLTKIKDRDKILKGTCPQRWPCPLKAHSCPGQDWTPIVPLWTQRKALWWVWDWVKLHLRYKSYF